MVWCIVLSSANSLLERHFKYVHYLNVSVYDRFITLCRILKCRISFISIHPYVPKPRKSLMLVLVKEMYIIWVFLFIIENIVIFLIKFSVKWTFYITISVCSKSKKIVHATAGFKKYEKASSNLSLYRCYICYAERRSMNNIQSYALRFGKRKYLSSHPFH